MKENKKSILVPTDFTEVARYALQHATRVAGVVKETITLLHVVDSDEKVKEAEKRLKKLSEESAENYGVGVNAMVRAGSIFEEIPKAADEVNASLVIMGSHSIKGKPTINDSLALKVILQSKVPFITIQEPPVNKRYDDIVFPIDFTTENKEKHTWISYFCDYYISRFHLIEPLTTDPKLRAKVDLNMASARKCLDEKGARYNIYTVKGEKSYAEEVLELAVNIRADLIVIMTTKLDNKSRFMVEPHEQYIIANAGHIPVMSINPR